MIRLRTSTPARRRGDPERDEGWAAAARAERRLQAVQVGILVVLSLIVVVVAGVTGRQMVRELDNYRAEQRTQTQLDQLKYTLQEQETAFWRRRGAGETGVTKDAATALFGVAQTARELSEGSSVTAAVSPEAIAATLRDLDTLTRIAFTTGDVGPVGSPGERRFVARVLPVIKDLKESAGTWGEQNAATLEATNTRVAAAARRIIVVTGTTALLAILLGLLTWRLTSRSRRRVLDALQGATERLRHLADTDPLTGLSNQRLLHDRLQQETATAQVGGSGLSAIMIDLDHFKAVNDTFGHPVGDAVLVETARRIRESSRAGDVIARIGGEEFLMLLPGTDGETALAVAERVRAAVRATDYPGGAGRLTASLGVATLSADLDADGLLAQADAALYWAKRHGRDASFRFDAALMGDLSVPDRAREIAREDGLAALRALARAIDARDSATQRHSIRVADMAVMLATALGWTAPQTTRLREAGLVHDVGKIGIPDAILLKATGLTPEERELMKDHAHLGARIVSEVLDEDQVGWVAHHHERWDGEGYPNRIADVAIPEGARILAVADSWDAMTSARDYSIALTPDEALDECRRCSGTHFWPAAVEALGRLDAAGALGTLGNAEIAAG